MNIYRGAKHLTDKEAIFQRISEALLCDYSSVYYVNAVTNEYLAYSMDENFRSLKISFEGKDFFKDLITDSEKVIYPDDKHIFQKDIQKKNLMRSMKERTMRDIKYRLMIDGKPVYHSLRLIRGISEKDEYFILGVTNIDEEVRMQEEAERLNKEKNIYNQIAQSLAARYDTIYYVNSISKEYMEFSASDVYENLKIPKKGSDFYEESYKNLEKYVHPEDKANMYKAVEADFIGSLLNNNTTYSLEYRLLIGDDYRYTRMTAIWTNDKLHFIIGVEDIDEQVKRENEHIRELMSANEKALTDELTGVKNKNAYHEAENALQNNLESGKAPRFAILVCDLNDLKNINDSLGHKAGDDYIKAACSTICRIFAHSPVYRIGGDEFVVILKGNDFDSRDDLLLTLRREVIENIEKPSAPVIASGLAEYSPAEHATVSDIFRLADSRMYANKKDLKMVSGIL